MQYGILKFDEPKPDISRKILHVDMDAFYASVEIRNQPHLKDKPVVIAKHPKLTNGRGIVTTCNYIARQYGIHSAMSSMEAYKRCPHAIFIAGNYSYYREVSQQIRAIFYQYTDLVEPLSLDEAYLDVTNNKKRIKSATIIAKQIQQQILNELQLTCSIGISYNKFIAKIASDFHKPYGLTLVSPEEAIPFLENLPIEKFYGVGRKSVPYFHEKGIKIGNDLAKKTLEELENDFGKMGHSLFFKVRGIHNSAVKSSREQKSIGKETTFSQFLEFEPQVLEILKQLTDKVIKNLQSKGLQAHTITVKIRYENFETITRQMQVAIAFDENELAFEMVKSLWSNHGHLKQKIRLLGVSVSNFDDPDFELIRLNLE